MPAGSTTRRRPSPDAGRAGPRRGRPLRAVVRSLGLLRRIVESVGVGVGVGGAVALDRHHDQRRNADEQERRRDHEPGRHPDRVEHTGSQVPPGEHGQQPQRQRGQHRGGDGGGQLRRALHRTAADETRQDARADRHRQHGESPHRRRRGGQGREQRDVRGRTARVGGERRRRGRPDGHARAQHPGGSGDHGVRQVGEHQQRQAQTGADPRSELPVRLGDRRRAHHECREQREGTGRQHGHEGDTGGPQPRRGPPGDPLGPLGGQPARPGDPERGRHPGHEPAADHGRPRGGAHLGGRGQ